MNQRNRRIIYRYTAVRIIAFTQCLFTYTVSKQLCLVNRMSWGRCLPGQSYWMTPILLHSAFHDSCAKLHLKYSKHIIEVYSMFSKTKAPFIILSNHVSASFFKRHEKRPVTDINISTVQDYWKWLAKQTHIEYVNTYVYANTVRPFQTIACKL